MKLKGLDKLVYGYIGNNPICFSCGSFNVETDGYYDEVTKCFDCGKIDGKKINRIW